MLSIALHLFAPSLYAGYILITLPTRQVLEAGTSDVRRYRGVREHILSASATRGHRQLSEACSGLITHLCSKPSV